MKKAIKKIVISLVSIVLAVAIMWGTAIYMYYPHYHKNKRQIEMTEVSNVNEIKVMSYNIRCHAVNDFGHKNWFYRANLVVNTIENAQPFMNSFKNGSILL